jgi:hypothetical protein
MRVLEQVTRCGFKTLLKAVVYCYTGSVSFARESEVTNFRLSTRNPKPIIPENQVPTPQRFQPRIFVVSDTPHGTNHDAVTVSGTKNFLPMFDVQSRIHKQAQQVLMSETQRPAGRGGDSGAVDARSKAGIGRFGSRMRESAHGMHVPPSWYAPPPNNL